MIRKAKVERKTRETEITVEIIIDGSGKSNIQTSVPFLNHMLELLAQHGLFDITLRAKGDIEVDYHHTVEDIGLCLGECFKKALGDFKGIRRYGESTVPMGESLGSVVLDICNRPNLIFNTPLVKGKVGTFDIELVKEFFNSFAQESGISLHINVTYGDNTHHIIESIFKAFARALDIASTVDKRITGVMSTKGKL
ncbi:MAG: imidazoleglycerol-phosphate dehydratase [Deltaproteobacteria bacterium DG_8]|nr:MAG: imidazoleglycerol-phosphate dehydratase [Deltaproteobacteria bacterium DG_8]